MPATAAPARPRESGLQAFVIVSAFATCMLFSLALATPVRAQNGVGLCDMTDGDQSSNSQSRTNDVTTIKSRYGDCRSEVRVEGDILFNDDFTAVEQLSRDGLIRMEVRRPGERLRLELEPGSGGEPTYTWFVDNRVQPFDDGAQAWFAEALTDLFKSSGFMAEERASWIIAQRGTDGLMAEVESMWKEYVQSKYLRTLLEQRDLPSADISRAVAFAAREIESDHSLGKVLETAAEYQQLDRATAGALVAAAGSIESDHTHGKVLTVALERSDLGADNVAAILESAAAGIESDHTLANILIDLVDRYHIDEDMRPAYLRAAASIESDHSKGKVYEALMEEGGLTGAELGAILDASTTIESDHTLSNLLIDVAEQKTDDAGFVDAYLRAARSIESDHSLSNVMEAFFERDLEDHHVIAGLAASKSIESDHSLGKVLDEVADRYKIEGEVREAFLDALDTIESQHTHDKIARSLRRD